MCASCEARTAAVAAAAAAALKCTLIESSPDQFYFNVKCVRLREPQKKKLFLCKTNSTQRMTDDSENLQQIDPQTLENYLELLCTKLQAMHETMKPPRKNYLKRSVQSELRTLDFWRSVISECLASFFYNLLVCGALTGAGPGVTTSNVTIIAAFASGFSIIALTQCFGSISGAFVNPAIIVAALVTKNLSFVRAIVYVIAQCGGAIAAAALLYGISIIGHHNSLLSSTYLLGINASERFGLEFALTFLLALTFLISRFLHKRLFDISPITIGAAYTACTFVSLPHLNPARSLGPSFVLNRWDMHWVFWLGPVLGAFFAGLIFEFIYNSSLGADGALTMKDVAGIVDADCSTIDSDGDTYDDLRHKSHHMKLNGSEAAKRSALAAHKNLNGSSYCSGTLYSNNKLEPIYGGTKSLYCKSPALTRANLNRSQSVYAKSNSAINKDDPALYRSSHMLPAQSMYPIRYANLPPSGAHYPPADHVYGAQNASIAYQKALEHDDARRNNAALPYAGLSSLSSNASRTLNAAAGGGGGGNNGNSGNTGSHNNHVSSDDSNYCLSFLNSASSNHRFNAGKNICRNNPY